MIRPQPNVLATISATKTLFCHGSACGDGSALKVAKCCSITTENERPSTRGMTCHADTL